MVKEIVKTGVRKALHDQKRTHKSSSKSRYNDVNDENSYINQNEISSGSSSSSDSDSDSADGIIKMKKKRNSQSRSQSGTVGSRNDSKLDNRKGGRDGMKRRHEDYNTNKMRKQKSNLRSGGRFAADFTGPTGLLHARGHGQGSDKTTSYAEGTYVMKCTYDSPNCS